MAAASLNALILKDWTLSLYNNNNSRNNSLITNGNYGHQKLGLLSSGALVYCCGEISNFYSRAGEKPFVGAHLSFHSIIVTTQRAVHDGFPLLSSYEDRCERNRVRWETASSKNWLLRTCCQSTQRVVLLAASSTFLCWNCPLSWQSCLVWGFRQ